MEEREAWDEIAAARGVTLSDLVRDALERQVGKLEKERRSGETSAINLLIDPSLGERLDQQAARHSTDATAIVRQGLALRTARHKRA